MTASMRETRPGPAPSGLPNRGPSCAFERARARLPGAVLAALAALLTGLACVCPPSAEALTEVGHRTPRQTFESFQTYLRTDLPDLEYGCFSAGFKRRNGLSQFTYAEGRERLLDEKPWFRLFAKAEIVAEEAQGKADHRLDARVLGRTFRVKLVREDFFEIGAGDELVADGYRDFDRMVQRVGDDSGSALAAQVALDVPVSELARATRVVFERAWKIDDVWELNEGDGP